LATGKAISHLYGHWTAGHYGSFFRDYHINIDQDGSIYVSTDDLETVLAHTWHRNTGSVGIALACCYNGTSNDLGPEPPTEAQIKSLSEVIAVLCRSLGLSIDADTVMTHAEAADRDGYGPATSCERWDLAILRNGDAWMSGGDQLRSLAQAAIDGGAV
jgi:N-acetyl-anhydromuramyl-L-alanine amidase AmpD